MYSYQLKLPVIHRRPAKVLGSNSERHGNTILSASEKQATMVQRQTPARTSSGSFVESVSKMRDSLTRSLSFTTNPRKGFKSLSTCDEMNVFASDIVSKEYILDRLKDVRHDPRIVKLEVEDLLIARNHNSFLPVVKAILVTDERAWKYLRFVDTIPSSDFLWWQGVKHVMMREYEDTIDDESKYTNVVSFQGNIQVMEGTNKRSISCLFKGILQDKDVISVSFGGSLFGYHDATLPHALMGVMDEATGLLKQSFVINVKCGWQKKSKKGKQGEDLEEAIEADLEEAKVFKSEGEGAELYDWAKVLKSLHRSLRVLGRAKPNPQEDDTEASDAVHAFSSSLSALSVSSDGHSIDSDGRRSLHSHGRIPRNSRRKCPRRNHSNPNNLPIVQGEVRRCITMPANRGAARSSAARSPIRRPGVPQRTRSFQIKRPTLGENLESGDDSLDQKPKPRRAASFNIQRPAAESLAARTSEKAAEEDDGPLPESQESGALDAWLGDSRKGKKKDVAARAPIRRSSGHQRATERRRSSKGGSSSKSSKSPPRRPSEGTPLRRQSSHRSSKSPVRRVKSADSEQDGTVELRRTKSLNHPHPRRPLDPPGQEVRRSRSDDLGGSSLKKHCDHPHEERHHRRRPHREHEEDDPDKTPDYDWSVGDYVEKRIAPSAA